MSGKSTKTAIVTGASGNLGHAVVKKFIEAEYKVIGTVLHEDPFEFDFTFDQFEKVPVDLSNEAASNDFINTVIEKEGKVDAAVLTVGGFAMGNIADTPSAAVAHQYKLNFETAYHVARPLFTHMMAQKKGRIFLIGSKPGLNPAHAKGMTAYSLSKTLLFHLAELMNAEAKGTDVVTAVIVPGTIDTPQNRRSMPDADFTKWVNPAAIAGVITWYCSEAGSIIKDPIIKVFGNS